MKCVEVGYFGNRAKDDIIHRHALHMEQIAMVKTSRNNEKPKPMMAYYKHYIQLCSKDIGWTKCNVPTYAPS